MLRFTLKGIPAFDKALRAHYAKMDDQERIGFVQETILPNLATALYNAIESLKVDVLISIKDRGD